MALEMIGLHDFVAQPYSGKVTKAFHSTPSGSETTAKITGLGVKLSPSHPTRVNLSFGKTISHTCTHAIAWAINQHPGILRLK